jgi:excinuclease ABC subunit C
VFISGQPEKNLYRRYRLKTPGRADDYARLAEALSRRLRSGEALPNLIVVDGGRGQVGTVLSVFNKMGIAHHPLVIGLAKAEEMIYHENGEVLRLPVGSPALSLLQRLRDESHRFSRKYHLYLRSKQMLKTT